VAAHPQPGGRRRGTAGIVLIVVGVLVLAGAVVADRLAARAAASYVAEQLQTELSTTSPPAVTIGGFPFLTQLATNTFRRIDLAAPAATIGTDPALPLANLHATLTTVHADRAKQEYRIGELTGGASISWAGAAKVTGIPLAYDPATRGVRFTVASDLLGRSLQVTVTATPRLDVAGQRITFADATVTVAGVSLPPGVTASLLQQLVPAVPLALPYGLKATELVTQPEGLTIAIAGHDVLIRR